MESLGALVQEMGGLLPFIFVSFFALALLVWYRALQAAKTGAKPPWGVPVWSETLPLDLASRLALVSAPVQMRSSASGAPVVTEILRNGEELLVKVVGSAGRLRFPYVGTVRMDSTPLRIRYRMDPLIFVGFVLLLFVVFQVFSGSWIPWVFGGWLLVILVLNALNVRRAVLPQLRQWAEGSSSQPVGVQL